MRVIGYDTRVARRFNLDPIDQIFISNYAGFGNNPIYYTDPSGYSSINPEVQHDITADERSVQGLSTGGSYDNPIVSETAIVTATRETENISNNNSNTNNDKAKPNVGEIIVTSIKERAESIGNFFKTQAQYATDNGNGKFLGANKDQWAYAAISATPVLGSVNNASNSFHNGNYLEGVVWYTIGTIEAFTFGGAYWLRTRVFGTKTVAQGTWTVFTFDDLVANPKLLWGKSADEVQSILGEGWVKSTYGSKELGWKFINQKHPNNMVFHSINGTRHGGSPYWGISTSSNGRIKVVSKDYIPTLNDKAKIIYMD